MTNHLVSIATPTYNREHFHQTLMEIVKAQDYPHENLEWVIIDDSETPSRHLKDLQTLNRITVRYQHLETDKPIPVGQKRNMLSMACRGKYIVNMDDDDYYSPDRISDAVRVLESGCEIAGNSKLYIYFTDIDSYYQFGPYNDNHATGATLAYSRKYALTHKWAVEGFAEESSFTKGCTMGLTSPETLLAVSHNSNTVDKSFFLEPKYGQTGSKIVKLAEPPVQVPDQIMKFYQSFRGQKKVQSAYNADVVIKLQGSADKMRKAYDEYCRKRLAEQVQKVSAIYRFFYAPQNRRVES